MPRIFGALLLIGWGTAVALAQEAPTAGDALIDGSVVNRATGAPVKRAHVMFVRAGAAGAEDSESSADTDSGGRYSADLPAGQYQVWVERPGFSRLNYGASTSAGAGKLLALAAGQQMHDVTFRISPLGAISGHVIDEDGDPIQGAGIQVLKFSYATGRRTVVPVSGTSSNDRGEYRAFGLPPGRYFLLVTQPGAPLTKPLRRGMLVADAQDYFAPLYYPGVLNFSEAGSVVLAEGAEAQDTDIRLQRIQVATLRGRIVSPIENFADGQVQVIMAACRGCAGSYVNRPTAVIDRLSGRFEFHNVAPGAYVLVGSQGYRGRVVSGRVAIEVSGGHNDEISLPLAPGAEIAGTIELDHASPDTLKGAQVTLTDPEGLAPGPQPSAVVESGGTFRLSGVPAGAWDISLSALPKAAWIKSIFFDSREIPGATIELATPAPAALRIVLSSAAASVSGTVVRDGQAARATVVLVPDSADLRANGSNYWWTASDEQGAFSLTGVRPGSYKLFAFEEVEPYAWLDPDFLKAVESSGEEITVAQGDAIKKQISPVTNDPAQPTP